MTFLHIILIVWIVAGFVISIKRKLYYNKIYGSITLVDLWVCVLLLFIGPLVVTVEYIITITKRRKTSNRPRKNANIETL